MHHYEVRPRADRRGVDLVSDQLPHGRLWYSGTNAVENAIGYAKFFSRTHETEVVVHDQADQVSAVHRWDARTPLDLVI